MNPERGLRWTDARLDDRFETITDEMRGLRGMPETLGRFDEKLANLKKDTDGCFAALRELRDDFQTYCEEQAQLHEAHRLERKDDRKWMIGTAFAAASFVIAAVAVLAGHF